MIKVSVVGATGYAGEELIDLLLKHPDVRIANVCAKIDKPAALAEIFPRFKNRIDLICGEPNVKAIAASCDLRICGVSSRFGVPINRLGLSMGLREMQGLLSLVGKAVTLEILLEGRVFSAEEALQKGLVTRVVPDNKVEEEAYATARRIADGAPLVARWHKKFMRRLHDPAPLTPADLDEGYACYDTEDFRTGYQAFLAKSKPGFKGR